MLKHIYDYSSPLLVMLVSFTLANYNLLIGAVSGTFGAFYIGFKLYNEIKKTIDNTDYKNN